MENINMLPVYNLQIWRKLTEGQIDYEMLEEASELMCTLNENCELGHNFKVALEESTESMDRILVVHEFLMESRRICQKHGIFNEALNSWVVKDYFKIVQNLYNYGPTGVMVLCDCLMNTDLYHRLPRNVDVEGAVRALILNEKLSTSGTDKLIHEVLPQYTNLM